MQKHQSEGSGEPIANIRASTRRFVIHMHIVFALQTVGYCAGLYFLVTRLCRAG
jgi:hypothetical protein